MTVTAKKKNGFVIGIVTGAAVGAALGAVYNGRQSTHGGHLRKKAAKALRNVGGIADAVGYLLK